MTLIIPGAILCRVDNKNHCLEVECADDSKCSDGYHTFEELYRHRCLLFLALLKAFENAPGAYRSRTHHDGSSYDGWFVVGVTLDKPITYHLPNAMWELCDFLPTLERAPEWDGHSSDDVCQRLEAWLVS